jgi:hypothetical protein
MPMEHRSQRRPPPRKARLLRRESHDSLPVGDPGSSRGAPHVGPYKGDTALFRRLFERLFAWAEPCGLMSPNFRHRKPTLMSRPLTPPNPYRECRTVASFSRMPP